MLPEAQRAPSKAQSVSFKPRSVPSTARSVPSTVRNVPSRVRSVPSRVRSVPSRVRSVSSRVRSVPSRARSVASRSHVDLKYRKRSEMNINLPEEERRPGIRELGVVKWCLLSHWIQLAAVLMVLSLLYPMWLFNELYEAELTMPSEKKHAVKRIQNAVVEYDNTFADKNVSETIKGVRLLLKDREKQRAINEEVQKSIDEVVRRLQDTWIPFRGYLYLLDETKENFTSSVKKCSLEKAQLVIIDSEEEEDFLEAEVTRRKPRDDEGYWIALQRNIIWRWSDGEVDTFGFWAKNQPRKPFYLGTVCGCIGKCSGKRKCWKDEECKKRQGWICKWKGDTRWL